MFVFTKKKNVIKKEIFAKKSIIGINIAGKTIILDNTYISLLLFNQKYILFLRLLSTFLANN